MEKRPLKSRKLKVIDYLGTLYATQNGNSIYRIDRVAFGILKLCDGKKTFDELVKEVANKAFVREEDLKPVLKKILDELTKLKFLEWV